MGVTEMMADMHCVFTGVPKEPQMPHDDKWRPPHGMHPSWSNCQFEFVRIDGCFMSACKGCVT